MKQEYKYEIRTYRQDIETMQHLRVEHPEIGWVSYAYRNGNRSQFFDSGNIGNSKLRNVANTIARENALNSID
jgi:hypothetical protein